MIKRIELINFMSHRHTVIEPAEGLTVLVGPNNCGKSAVVAALQILCHNENSTYVTRHGESECSIKLETSDGHEIQWSRKRSSSKYIINGETFDRLRGNVPDALLESLRLPLVKLDQSNEEFDIHFGSQKEPVFLLNQSGRSAAGFFAASSDASRLLEMQKLHGQKTKDSQREFNRLEVESKQLEKEIEHLRPIVKLKDKSDRCGEILRSIEIHEAAIGEIKRMVRQIDVTEAKLNELNLRLRFLEKMTEPPELLATAHLKNLIEKIRLQKQEVKMLELRQKILESTPAPIDVEETFDLRKLVEAILETKKGVAKAKQLSTHFKTLPTLPVLTENASLKCVIRGVKSTSLELKKLQAKLDANESAAQELNGEISAYLQSNPTCPQCGQAVTESHWHAMIGSDVND